MKYILVTGAYGGMGCAAIKLLRDKGFFVFAMDKKTCEAEQNIFPIEADITSEESVNAAMEIVRAHTDSLYAILHFAGLYMLDSLVEMSDEAFRHIFDVNVRGTFLVNKIFFPLLKKGSRILITTSELAPLDPLPFTGIYAVTKAALDKYAYSLCMELQLLGIKVSVLRAGAVKTGMLGVSTDALESFCENTAIFSCNADRFKRIVERVEARCVSPQKIAQKAAMILEKRHTKFAYSVNRNPLLLLMNFLPKRLQLLIIKTMLR
jgi:NAD(P)-dependent dehydrogenase (short-subunit alcohol dehydrogenase family)